MKNKLIKVKINDNVVLYIVIAIVCVVLFLFVLALVFCLFMSFLVFLFPQPGSATRPLLRNLL